VFNFGVICYYKKEWSSDKYMKNPIDYQKIGYDFIFPTMTLIFALLAYLMSFGIFLPILFLGMSSVFIIIIIFTNLYTRPVNVEIGNTITFIYRSNKIYIASLESIRDLVIYPENRRTKNTAGVVRFRDRNTAIDLSYEIISTIDQLYFDKFGKHAPLPIWYIQRHPPR